MINSLNTMLSKKSLSMLNRYKMTILMTLMNTREIVVLQGIVKCNCKMDEYRCTVKVNEEISKSNAASKQMVYFGSRWQRL